MLLNFALGFIPPFALVCLLVWLAERREHSEFRERTEWYMKHLREYAKRRYNVVSK